jgi:transcriptional regulator with XRE-family HTH domain
MPGDRQTPTVRLRGLAAELRSLRTSSGLTRDEIVERTGINVATLYRIEHARVRPQTRTLRTLLDLYGVEEAHQGELAARAVIRGGYPSASRDEVERRVQVRMERQNVLRGESPLDLWGIVDETALRRQVGGREVRPGRDVRAAVWWRRCRAGRRCGMRGADGPRVRWHKSSHSSANGQCVEVAPVAGAVAVRDSKNPAGPGPVFTRQAWVAFVEGVKSGQEPG